MSDPASLPLEIIQAVLDDLHDLSSLRSCALVCREWLWSTRVRLFHTLSLRVDYKSDYHTLIDILETSPGIADCVRCLKLTGSGSHPPYLMSNGMGRICAHFSRIESLKISEFRFPHIDETIFVELLSSISAVVSSVKTLAIDSVRFANGDQIGSFISAFPHLTELDLSHSGFIDGSVPSAQISKQVLPQAHRPRLRTLRMIQCYGDFSQQLIKASTLHLQHLTIRTNGFDGLYPVLEASAPETLESLEIALSGPGPSANDLCHFPARLSNLQAFAVHAYDDHGQGGVDWLYTVLSNLPPTLVYIDLYIELDAGVCQTINWENIEGIIESRRLVFLRRVVLIFYLYGNCLQVIQESLIERLMKLKMSQSGVLQIQF